MLARAVINGALRKLGRLGGGREARPADQADTLAALQGLYRSMIASGAFGRLNDVVPRSAEFVASPNTRIYRQDSEVDKIVLPSLVSRGWWGVWSCWDQRYNSHAYGDVILDLNYVASRYDITTPCDGAVVVINDCCTGGTQDFLYDNAVIRWQPVHDLGLDDEAPRSFADPQGLMAALAIEVADEFGADVTPILMMQAGRFKAAATIRYGMERSEGVGVYF